VDPSDRERNDLGNGAPRDADGPTYVHGPEGYRWLRSVVENSSEIVTIVDPDGTLRYANPAWERALGYDSDEAIGTMNVLDHVHPEDLAHVLEETEEVLAEGGVTNNEAEYRFRHKDGSWRWVESVGTYLLDDPHVRGVVVQTRDITERKESEEALRRNEQYFRSLVQNASDIITILEADGTIRYVSHAVEKVTGQRPEEQIGTNAFDSVHPDDRERALALFAERLKTPGPRPSIEFRVPHEDGSWRYLEHVVNNLLDDPSVNGIVVTSRDVTDRKESEEALRESERRLRRAEQRYRNLVERVPAVVYVQQIGSSESAMYMSPRIEDLTGYTPEECKDSDLRWRMVHPEDRERMQAEDERTGEPGEVFASEYRVLHRGGRTVWVRNESVLIEDEEGGSRYWQGFMLDITERKLAEEALKESEQRFRSTFENAPIGVALVSLPSPSPDSATRYLRVNPALCEMLGYSEEELLSMTSSDVTHPEDLEESRARAERLVEEGGSKYTIEKRYVRSDGRVVWAMLNVSLVRDSEGNPSHFVSQYQDVTQRKETEEALRRSEERYRNVVEEQTELVCRFLPDLTLTFVNDAYCRYFGKRSEELVGSCFLDDVHETDHAYYNEQLMKLNPESPTSTIEERVFTPVGIRWLQWTDTAIFDDDGRIVEYQSVGRDVTERREAEERLEHLAFHDPLTDLPNRHLFLDRLGRALERTRRRRGRKAAVLYMDLDRFKVVNDSLGHEMGDLLLTVVAQRLGRCLRPEDTLARFGGDEFVVLIEAIDDSVEAVQVAERITQELRRPFIMEGRELYVTASIGISLGDARTHDPDGLLREADTAMYRAKDEGGTYTIFDPTMYDRAFRRLEVENDLRRAIEQEEFIVHYQPIVRLDDDGDVWRIEALVRWNHPERGLLDPDEFVPVAEESGLVVPMGEQVLEQACRRAVEWQRQFPRSTPLVMCVNLSARQLSRPDLAETVERVLGETGLKGSHLTLDITETVYVKALAASTTILDRLRGLGVGFSIDDFGTGYSSLSYLKRLPADAIKIDKSFVKGLGYDVEDTAVVRMIIELTHTLGREVVAEGVESAEQAWLLKEMGCDFAQGYHFAQPLLPEEIPALLSPNTLT
jgi:diguanylate cyclase (GGDEF)-like protein/PAS domain S-box-containing protein